MPYMRFSYSPQPGPPRTRLPLILWSLVFFLTILFGATGGLFTAYLKDLPSLDPLEEYQPSLTTTLYADDDESFASLFEQKRSLVPLQKIPGHLIHAIIAVEDARFYHHRGIDPRGIVRAIVNNLRARRALEGGSTITQQLAKVLFLTPEKSLSRKIKEALLAIAIEKRYSKDQILELYFNQIYFGHGAYGVEAAAHTYFQKSVEELTLPEVALLAGLPRAPNYYSPMIDKGRAMRRREHVLNRMTEMGFITKDQALAAAHAPIDDTRFARTRNLAPYFVETIRQYLEERYGTYAVYHGGLKVYTTLNTRMQQAAEDALIGGLREIDKSRGYRGRDAAPSRRPGYVLPEVGEILTGTITQVTQDRIRLTVGRYTGEILLEKIRWARVGVPTDIFQKGQTIKVQVVAVDAARKHLDLALEQDPDLEGAFLAMDPQDGAIKVMVGGYDFERSKFNRATQAKRQPGSAFKPFVYAAAFDQGLTPSTVMEDSPVTYPVILQGQPAEWSPQNYDGTYRGAVTLRQALENSINVIAVKLIEKVGVGSVIRMAQQMGITSELRPEYALALGVSEVTLQEMVSAYGVLANRGIRTEPYMIRKIADNRGRVLEEHFGEGQRVIREETAFVLTNVLKGVIERGTAVRARVLNRPLAGKTGTTDEATDVWFIGYTPQLVAGVWVGYDTKKSLGPQETSAHLAVPIWIRFAQKIFPEIPREDFPIPDNVILVPVNYQTGLPTAPDDKSAIAEYFIRGTEPRRLEVWGPSSGRLEP